MNHLKIFARDVYELHGCLFIRVYFGKSLSFIWNQNVWWLLVWVMLRGELLMQYWKCHLGPLSPISECTGLSSGSSSSSSFPLQLPVTLYSGRQQVMAQVLGSLPPAWETLVKVQPLGFDLAQPWLLWILWGANQWIERRALCLSLSFLCFWNKAEYIKNIMALFIFKFVIFVVFP